MAELEELLNIVFKEMAILSKGEIRSSEVMGEGTAARSIFLVCSSVSMCCSKDELRQELGAAVSFNNNKSIYNKYYQ